MSDDYVKQIVDKLDMIDDNDLKNLIKKLIDERNYLVNTIKIDPLTGTYNRRILQSVRKFSVLALCDLDNFKDVNDVYGHDAGDSVLKIFSGALINNCRANDIVCRFGGDEFLIVFDDCPIEVVQQRMEKVQEYVAEQTKNADFSLSFSVGLASYQEGKTLDETLKEADIALYESKKNGKNIVSRYDLVTSNRGVSR